MIPNPVDRTPLDGALEAARRGWYVFPLHGKVPPAGLSWPKRSTTDEAVIRLWAVQYPDCNFGVDCGKSGIVVLDVDVRPEKDGRITLGLLEVRAQSLLPPTFQVRTPSGGDHYYYTPYFKNPKSKNGLGLGLDLKARGGYVVLWGSRGPGGTPYWVFNSLPLVPLPAWLTNSNTTEKPPRAPLERDKPEHIAWATEYLLNEAPSSIQGQAGDDTLYRVFCELHNHGISEAASVDLVLKHYNSAKATPPWSYGDLQRKAANAAKYAILPAGSKTDDGAEEMARNVFGIIASDAALPAVVEPALPIRFADAINPATIPARKWILQDRLLRGYITGTFAPGGVGKSLFTFVEALSVATGYDLCGNSVREKGPVLLYNAEDSLDELEMRFNAVCQHYGVTLSDLNGVKHEKVALCSGRDFSLRVVALGADRKSYTINGPAMKALVYTLRTMRAALFVGDPFVRLHDVDENDNVAIDKVAEVFSNLAHSLNISVHLVHHTRKRTASGGEGDAESSRGASSFVNAMRIAHTLVTMSEDDAKIYGVPPDLRQWYVRCDNAKSNLAVPQSKVIWYKKHDIVIPNGEHVGTLQRINLDAVVVEHTGLPMEVVQACLRTSMDSEREMADLAEEIARSVPSNKTVSAIYQMLRKYGGSTLTLGDRTAQFIARPRGSSVRVTRTKLDFLA